MMTLDLVMLRPEFFFLFGFLVLLWYGTGGLITPVAEKMTVAEMSAHATEWMPLVKNQVSARNSDVGNRTFSHYRVAGPHHAASTLTLWRLLWCFLSAALMLYAPLQSVYLGGCFQKDHYTSTLCGILFVTALMV